MNVLRRLAQWWAGELLAMLPLRLRGRAPSFIGLDCDPAQLARMPVGRGGEIVVRLPDSGALHRTITLPLAAERNLATVLGFEMDRYTPFMARDVFYDFAILSKDPQRRVMQVSLIVVPRDALAPLLKALRDRGLEPAALEVNGRRVPLREQGRRTAGAWRLRTLAAASALLVLAAAALPLAQKMQAVDALEPQIGALRKDALLAEQARKDLARLAAEENALVERRKQRPTAIRTVHELTRLLPDTTWLSHLDVNGPRVRIRGESSNASEVLKAIERSALFTDASFDGSVTRDPGSERERFAITASVRP
jgi:general secretion pathway protein L